MFEILWKMLRVGRVTRKDLFDLRLPDRARVSLEVMGDRCTGCGRCMEQCPTGAISFRQDEGLNAEAKGVLLLDHGHCITCGLCVETCETRLLHIRPTSLSPLREREDFRVEYRVENGWVQRGEGRVGEDLDLGYGKVEDEEERRQGEPASSTVEMEGMESQKGQEEVAVTSTEPLEMLEERLRRRIRKVLGHSLHIRHLDSGSCNGCDFEMNALTNPIYDIQRFGVDFVASPRHADLIMVTGGVTRHLEEAVRATYEAASEPKMVVAVGTCAIGGGIIGHQYAHHGGVDGILPVTVYVPGCPPRPEAMIEGILMALDRYEKRRKKDSSIPSKPHSS